MEVYLFKDCLKLIDQRDARTFLSKEELDAASQFVTPHLSARYITQRALIYQTLSNAIGFNVRKCNLQFVNGKPLLPGGPFFSYSHSENNLCLAISSQPIGVDLELTNRKIEPEIFFQIGLFEGFKSVSSSLEFIQHWVVLESYFKFTGHGLPSELNSVNVSKINDIYKVKYQNLPMGQSVLMTLDDCALAVCAEQINSSVIKTFMF